MLILSILTKKIQNKDKGKSHRTQSWIEPLRLMNLFFVCVASTWCPGWGSLLGPLGSEKEDFGW